RLYYKSVYPFLDKLREASAVAAHDYRMAEGHGLYGSQPIVLFVGRTYNAKGIGIFPNKLLVWHPAGKYYIGLWLSKSGYLQLLCLEYGVLPHIFIVYIFAPVMKGCQVLIHLLKPFGLS